MIPDDHGLTKRFLIQARDLLIASDNRIDTTHRRERQRERLKRERELYDRCASVLVKLAQA